MNLTILKLEEVAKSEREIITAIEREITEEQNTGVLPWETEAEFNHRIELLNDSLSRHYENLNLIESLIKILKDRE